MESQKERMGSCWCDNIPEEEKICFVFSLVNEVEKDKTHTNTLVLH